MIIMITFSRAIATKDPLADRKVFAAKRNDAVWGVLSVCALSLLCMTAAAACSGPSIDKPIEQYQSSAATQATKKGVGTWGGDISGQAIADLGVSWYYDWSPKNYVDSPPTSTAPTNVDFVPMIWGENHLTEADVAEAATHGDTLLTFNEPDNPPLNVSGSPSSVQLSVERALELWPELEKLGMKLCSPAPANHDFNNPQNWLVRFMAEARNRSYRVDHVCLHWYGSNYETETALRELRGMLELAHTTFGLPIWLTEYALTNWSSTIPTYPSTEQQADFAGQSVQMLESMPFVARYAWFSLTKYTNIPEAAENTFLYQADGTPTHVGIAYRYGICPSMGWGPCAR